MNLEYVDLENAYLPVVSFRKSGVFHSNFTNATVLSVSFRESSAQLTEFAGALLGNADFTNSDLRGATGLVFDDCCIDGARWGASDSIAGLLSLNFRRPVKAVKEVYRKLLYSRKTDNPWSLLKRTYSGSRFVWMLVLLVAFFAPYAIEVAAWQVYSRAVTNAPNTVDVTTAFAIISGWREGLWNFAVTMLFVVYNVFRGVVTFAVSGLSEQVEQSKRTPEKSYYSPLYSIHVYFLSWFSYLAVGSFALPLMVTLFEPIAVPQSVP